MVPLRLRVAVHEISHCLSARFQGVPVHYAQIDPDGQGGGTALDETALNADERVAMFVQCAAREAEHMLFGPSPHGVQNHALDYSQAMRSATMYGAGDDLAGLKMLGVVRRDACEWVRENLGPIQYLAAELAARGTMTGDEIENLLSGVR